MFRLGTLALLLAAGCGAIRARALEDASLRAELSQRVVATLDRQRHYFSDGGRRVAFETRLHRIARDTSDAASYYRAVADALAELREGHTGLVGSREVPFGSTIPPVAILEVEGRPVVAGVAPGVEGGGLRPGDVVLAVDGRPAGDALAERLRETAGSTDHGRRARAVANLFAGRTDTPARVRVRGMDGRERVAFPLRFLLDDEGEDRARFGFLPERVHSVRISSAAAYVALPNFQPERYDELAAVFRGLGALPAFVLDLRGNPGGRIRTLQRIAGIFLDGPRDLVAVRADHARGREPVRAAPSPIRYRGALHVLVDERTGSAAELLAAALQDLGRAQIIGRRTAGSTRARHSVLLPGGVILHYAGPSEFRRRDEARIEGVGVEPDVVAAPGRAALASGAYRDPFLDPLVRIALRRN